MQAKPEAGQGHGIQRVRFRYSNSPEYRTVPINGAWGGLAANGSVQVDFYVERQAPPNEIVHEVVGTTLGPEQMPPERVGERWMEREVQVGCLMSVETAKVVGEWLLAKVAEHALIEAASEATPAKEGVDAS